jgi:hypothetical protein
MGRDMNRLFRVVNAFMGILSGFIRDFSAVLPS